MAVEAFISEPPVEARDERHSAPPAWSNEFELTPLRKAQASKRRFDGTEVNEAKSQDVVVSYRRS
jgi:hypothetical protein